VATTDSNGEARVTLTTNRTATVTVSAGSKTATATINAAGANSIAISVSPSTAPVNTPVTVTVTPTIGTNNLPPHVVVNWGDGSTSDLGIVAGATTATHTYTKTGFYTITATSTSEGGETASSSTSVTISAQQGLNISVTANPTNPAVNDQVVITATVSGDPTAVVQTYHWSVTSNTASENTSFDTTSNQTILTFGTTGTKRVTVTATTTDNRQASGSVQLAVQ
jgi:hypothetical protein